MVMIWKVGIVTVTEQGSNQKDVVFDKEIAQETVLELIVEKIICFGWELNRTGLSEYNGTT